MIFMGLSPVLMKRDIFSILYPPNPALPKGEIIANCYYGKYMGNMAAGSSGNIALMIADGRVYLLFTQYSRTGKDFNKKVRRH
jgi:hypothetical protein